MKRVVALTFMVLCSCIVFGQGLSLSFTSVTEARFHVYVNGILQNEKSRQKVVIENLRARKYHIRIVMDDPYEIAVTKSIRPRQGKGEYTVRFNPVRERIYVRKQKNKEK